MPDLMTIEVPDIPTARAERVWSHVLETAAREQSRSRRRRAVGISAGATTLAGVLGFALVAPTSSFASWTEVPTPIQVSLTDPRLTPCLTALTNLRQGQLGPYEAEPIVGERRGDFTTVLMADEGNASICIANDGAIAAGSGPAPALRRGQVLSVLANAGSTEAEDARYVYGRVAREVRAVTVVTEDGVRISASVGDGFFVAWWPAPGAPATVTATDESGAVLTSLSLSGGDRP